MDCVTQGALPGTLDAVPVYEWAGLCEHASNGSVAGVTDLVNCDKFDATSAKLHATLRSCPLADGHTSDLSESQFATNIRGETLF